MRATLLGVALAGVLAVELSTSAGQAVSIEFRQYAEQGTITRVSDGSQITSWCCGAVAELRWRAIGDFEGATRTTGSLDPDYGVRFAAIDAIEVSVIVPGQGTFDYRRDFTDGFVQWTRAGGAPLFPLIDEISIGGPGFGSLGWAAPSDDAIIRPGQQADDLPTQWYGVPSGSPIANLIFANPDNALGFVFGDVAVAPRFGRWQCFSVENVADRRAADTNSSGLIGVEDLFRYLEQFFSGLRSANRDCSNTIEVGDLFKFLEQFFSS